MTTMAELDLAIDRLEREIFLLGQRAARWQTLFWFALFMAIAGWVR